MVTSNPPANETYRVALAAVEAAWDAGCPVAGSTPDRRAEIARRAAHRWGTAARGGTSLSLRVEDLTADLIAAFEPNRELVGPLARDYDYLADCIATALQGGQADT
jgi:hypothetical protein